MLFASGMNGNLLDSLHIALVTQLLLLCMLSAVQRGHFIPSIRHDHIWDLTAHLLTEVCHNMDTEPTLQPLTDVSTASGATW